MKVSCFDILKVFGLDLILNIRDNNLPSAGTAGHEKKGLRPGQMERLRRQGKSWYYYADFCNEMYCIKTCLERGDKLLCLFSKGFYTLIDEI